MKQFATIILACQLLAIGDAIPTDREAVSVELPLELNEPIADPEGPTEPSVGPGGEVTPPGGDKNETSQMDLTDVNQIGELHFDGELPLNGSMPEANHLDEIIINERGELDFEALEGDIRVDESMAERNARPTRKWPNKTVYYHIQPGQFSSSQIADINSAIDEYRSKTCIRFVNQQHSGGYLRFIRSNGCWSYVGKIVTQGNQDLSMASGCFGAAGIVRHEIMHAIGFWHEHSRPDRDSYVTINWDNIRDGYKHNFDIKSTSTKISSYDYKSVMHYRATSFSKNGKYTIVPKGSLSPTILGQRVGFTSADIAKINSLYGCPGSCSPPIDRRLSCRYWAYYKGYCKKTYVSYMMANCCATCTECVDNHKWCNYWTGQGYCSGQYAAYMAMTCPKSCNKC